MSQHLPLVRSPQMAAIDRATIKSGIPGPDLMQRAGSAVWSAAVDHFDLRADTDLLFLCGKGNNGGDGFVAARLASMAGFTPTVVLLADETAVRGDARHHLDELKASGVAIKTNRDAKLGEAIAKAHIVFDAMLGTGVEGDLRPPFVEAVTALIHASAPILAVDVPSGMNADTGSGECADADLTVTFGGYKPAHIFSPGRERCGVRVTADIGLDTSAVDSGKSALVGFAASEPSLPVRPRTAHKGDAGRVTVVAGSVGMTGAASLTSEAALRSGAGLVTLGLPESLNDIAEVKLTEVMTLPLPEVRRRRCLSLRARGLILEACSGATSVAIGPGLGRHHETKELVRRLIDDIDVPTVVDADALNAFEGAPQLLEAAEQPLILTPHPGEYRRLVGSPVSDPIEDAKKLSETTGATVILKGAPTVIASPESDAIVNLSGNPGMATGGTGDVLTGITAGLLAQGVSTEEAASIATYWHGLAGDLAAGRLGERGLLAGDIVSAIPESERLMAVGESTKRYATYLPL